MGKAIIILSLLTLISDSCGQTTTKQQKIIDNENNDTKQISSMDTKTEKVDITGHWRIDAVIGLELLGQCPNPVGRLTKTDEYTLQKIKKEDSENGFIYGWQAEFNSDMTFKSYYSAWCGNDYFSDVTGTYEYIDSNHIKIQVNNIVLSGQWNREEELNTDLGIFLIDSINNGFRLIKCVNEETDQQRLMYSDMLRNLPVIRTGSDLKWIKLDPHNRDTDNQKILYKGLVADGRYNPDKAKLVFSSYLYGEGGEIDAFVFRYEEKNVVALYSRGPEIFALYDK
jgi:hypothetical protein